MLYVDRTSVDLDAVSGEGGVAVTGDALLHDVQMAVAAVADGMRSSSVNDAYQALVREARSLLGADAAVLNVTEDGRELVTVATEGLFADALLHARLRVESSQSGAVLETGATIRIPQAWQDRRVWHPSASPSRIGPAIVVRLAAFPPWGAVLALYNGPGGPEWSPAHADALEHFAAGVRPHLVALVATASEERTGSYEVFDSVLDSVTVLQAIRDDEGTLADFEIAYANGAAVDVSGRRIADLAGRRWSQEYPDAPTFEIYRDVLETGQPYENSDLHYRSQDGSSEGVYWLQVTQLADAVLIMFRDVTEERQRDLARVRDREAAQVLQDVFLTVELPEEPGIELAVRYLPASAAALGGDWYDAFPVRTGTCLVIGDVAGHGVQSAAIMAQLRHAIRAFSDDASPAAVLGRVNDMLRRIAPGEIATAVVAVWDPGSRTLRYSNAGHPPILRCRADVTDYLKAPPGVLLGATSTARYSDEVKQLRPDTTLVLYTDGLIESRHEPLDLGMSNLRTFAATAQDRSPQALCDAILGWRLETGRREDDLCLLAIRML